MHENRCWPHTADALHIDVDRLNAPHRDGESRALVCRRALTIYCRHDHDLSRPRHPFDPRHLALRRATVPYDVVTVDFSPAYRASPEWRRLNPVGKVPGDDRRRVVDVRIGRDGRYILERYGDGRLRPPPGTPAARMYLQWSWFAEATFARPLGDIAQHTVVKPAAERIPAWSQTARTGADVHGRARSGRTGRTLSSTARSPRPTS